MKTEAKSLHDLCVELFEFIADCNLWDLHDKYVNEPDEVRWKAAYDYAVFIDDLVGWEASIEWFRLAAERGMVEAHFPLGAALYYQADFKGDTDIKRALTAYLDNDKDYVEEDDEEEPEDKDYDEDEDWEN